MSDLIFLAFTTTSNKTQTLLTKGMEDLNRTNLKNILKSNGYYFAEINLMQE